MDRVTELLATFEVLGDEQRTTMIGLAFNEDGDIHASNQIPNLLFDDMRAFLEVVNDIDNRDKQELVAFLIGIVLPRLNHLFKVAHAVNLDKDAFLGAKEVKATATVLKVFLELHSEFVVLDELPHAIFAEFLHVGTIGEARTALNHTLVNHPLERFVFA